MTSRLPQRGVSNPHNLPVGTLMLGAMYQWFVYGSSSKSGCGLQMTYFSSKLILVWALQWEKGNISYAILSSGKVRFVCWNVTNSSGIPFDWSIRYTGVARNFDLGNG